MRTLIAVTGLVFVSAVCAVHAQDESAPAEVQTVTIYACPDHPEIAATWPAGCPYCHAALRRIAVPAGAAAGSASAGVVRPQTQPPMRQGEDRGDGFREREFRTPQFAVPFPNDDRREGFRDDQFGERLPNEEFRERRFGVPNDEFGERFRGDEFGEESPREESRERQFAFPREAFPRFRGDEFGEGFGEERFHGPEEVFPRGRFEFDDEFSQPGFDDEFSEPDFGGEFSQPGFDNESGEPRFGNESERPGFDDGFAESGRTRQVADRP